MEIFLRLKNFFKFLSNFFHISTNLEVFYLILQHFLSISLMLPSNIPHITSPGPRLWPIDKGDKEVIKFCHLWQASDKAEFCHCYVISSQVSTKTWEHYKSDKDFSRMRSLQCSLLCTVNSVGVETCRIWRGNIRLPSGVVSMFYIVFTSGYRWRPRIFWSVLVY